MTPQVGLETSPQGEKRYSPKRGDFSVVGIWAGIKTTDRNRAEVLQCKFQEPGRKLEDMAIKAFRNMLIVQYSQVTRENDRITIKVDDWICELIIWGASLKTIGKKERSVRQYTSHYCPFISSRSFLVLSLCFLLEEQSTKCLQCLWKPCVLGDIAISD